MNEKHIELFTKVEDGLPKEAGNYFVIRKAAYQPMFIDVERLIVNEKETYWYDYLNITHWLNLSKLTTIEKAKEAMIDYTDSIRDYEHENNGSIYNDDRDSKEFVEIYLTEKPL